MFLQRSPLVALVGAVILSFSACDLVTNESFTSRVVVESYLEAGAALPPVFLSRTIPVNTPYDPRNTSVNNAEVFIHLLDAVGEIEASYALPRRNDLGKYLREGGSAVTVLPLRTYRLEVRIPGEDPITAETVVPDTFTVARTGPDRLVYQGPQQPSVDLTPSEYPGRQAIYIFSVCAIGEVGDCENPSSEPDPANLTPFAASFFEADDSDIDLFTYSASPLLNEGNYDQNSDGTLTVRAPWLSINFYGENEFIISAIDDAVYDYLTTQAIQFNPTTISPGEIPNIASNVVGGVGIFGSYARTSVVVQIDRP